jgi:hypothetical protein
VDDAITEHKSAARRAFANCLRTGRIVSGPAVEPLETKFNPYMIRRTASSHLRRVVRSR